MIKKVTIQHLKDQLAFKRDKVIEITKDIKVMNQCYSFNSVVDEKEYAEEYVGKLGAIVNGYSFDCSGNYFYSTNFASNADDAWKIANAFELLERYIENGR